MARITQQITKFNIGQNSDIYGDGLLRMEHADFGSGQVRPFGEVIDDSEADFKRTRKYTKGAYVYGMGKNGDFSATQFSYNDPSTGWEPLEYSAQTFADVLFYYLGHLYGLVNGTNIWKITLGVNGNTSSGINVTHAALTYTTYCDPIIHSKDVLVYIAVDNKIYSFDGTTPTLKMTLPTNFVIVSIAEDGDFINILGYDSKSKQATLFIWNRDDSVATFSEKYDLGLEVPYYNFSLNGLHFVISLRDDSTNSTITEKKKLVIKMLYANRLKKIGEFYFSAIKLGGKFLDTDKFYFNARITPLTESSAHFCTFCLDENGRLTTAVNLGIIDATGTNVGYTGIMRDGDGFWIGGGNDGMWVTSDTFGTQTILETCKLRAKALNKSIDTIGVTITFDALPADGSVILKTRKDEEIAWTTLQTFSTDNSLKGAYAGDVNCGTAKTRQFQIISTGNAVITGLQIDLEEKDDEAYS